MATIIKDDEIDELFAADTAEPTAAPALNLDADRVDFKRIKKKLTIPPTTYDRIIAAKLPIIERWNGFRWHSPLVTGEIASKANTASIGNIINEEYGRYCQLLYNRGISATTSNAMFGIPAYSKPPRCFLSAKARQAEEAQPFYPGYSPREWKTLKVRKGQSYSRAILAHVKKLVEHVLETSKDAYVKTAAPLYLQMWDKIFSRIGELHKTEQIGARVTFSVAPSDIAWIGNMDVDLNSPSCYSYGGQWECTKYNIGLTPGGFVGFLYFTTEGREFTPYERIRASAPDARLWGFAHPDGIVLSNLYRATWDQVGSIFAEMLQPAFSTPAPIAYHDTMGKLTLPDNYGYSNQDAHVFPFPGVSKRKVETEIYDLCTKTPLVNATECASCSAMVRSDAIYNCGRGNHAVCRECLRRCENCRIYTCKACDPEIDANKCASKHVRCAQCRPVADINCARCNKSSPICCAQIVFNYGNLDATVTPETAAYTCKGCYNRTMNAIYMMQDRIKAERIKSTYTILEAITAQVGYTIVRQKNHEICTCYECHYALAYNIIMFNERHPEHAITI